MTGFRSYYMKSTKPLENYQELGLLPAAKILPSTNIAGIALRDKAVTSLPFPGATGNSVTTMPCWRIQISAFMKRHTGKPRAAA